MAQSFWGIVKGLVLRNDADKTKTLTIESSSSATTGTDTKLTAAQTASRTITLPDATDTLVGKATTDVLTNKTIDGDDNTVQDLALTSLKTNISDAGNFLVRNGSGVVISNTKAVPSGTVVGTTDTQTLLNKTIDGDDNTLQDISITSLKTVLADANKFIARDGSGAVVSTGTVPSGTIVGTTDTQTLSNKSLVDNSTFIVDNSDATKKIAFDAAGTTGTKTTLTSSQTTDRVITLPDATDTLVGKATTDTLTNKTISGGIHTGTINGSASTSVTLATTNTDSTLNIGTGSGNNTINIGGANSTITMTGTVLSEAVTNLTVNDKLITINKGGASSSGAATGLEIEENSSITGYAKTSSDRNSWEFKAPNTAGVTSLTPGSSTDTVTLNAASQTLTNKTISRATNTLSGYTANAVVIADSSGNATSEATLATSRGGTNIGSYTTGDIIYASSSSVLSKLPIGTTNNVLTVSGGIPSWASSGAGALNVTTKTANYTALTSDDIILCNPTSSFTVTLFTAVGNSGKRLYFKNTGTSNTNVVTIDGNSTETIDGQLTRKLNIVGESMTIVSDGSNWIIVDREYTKVISRMSGATQSIPNNTTTQYTQFTTADSDVGGMSDVGNNRININVSGYYQVHGGGFWDSNTTGVRQSIVKDNNNVEVVWNDISAAGGTVIQSSENVLYLVAGSTLRLFFTQTSGGSLNVSSGTYTTNLSAFLTNKLETE